MSVHISSPVWKAKLPATTKLVALSLADMANDLGECYPSMVLISKRCNIHPDTVRSHLVILEGFKMLKRLPRFVENRQTSNLYVFRPVAEWAIGNEGEGGSVTGGGVGVDRKGEGGSKLEGENHQFDPKDKHQGNSNLTEQSQQTGNRSKFPKNQTPKQNKDRASRPEIQEFCKSLGLPPSDGDFMFDHWESNGWRNGSAPVRDWQAGVRKWKGAGWLPSLKPTPFSNVIIQQSSTSTGLATPPCHNWRDILSPITGTSYEAWMEWRDVSSYDRSQWPKAS